MRRPRFSWTRIKGESDVQGGGEHGSVKEREGTWVGADGGSPEGDWSARRRRGRRGGGLAGLELGLKDQAGEPAVAALDTAKRHIGELSMEVELLRERARAAERRLPLPMRRSRR